MFTVGDQVEIIGELDGAWEFFENVDAEALAAQFSVRFRMTNTTANRGEKHFYHLEWMITQKNWPQPTKSIRVILQTFVEHFMFNALMLWSTYINVKVDIVQGFADSKKAIKMTSERINTDKY